MRLVYDDDVPVGLLQVGAVLGVLLQGVDRDDRLVVVVERVVAGRDAAAHPLDADRVELGERDREPVPELLLELRQHALDGQHQDPPTRPRAISSLTRMPASSVFPSPTASAIRIRCRGWRSACRAGSNW